MALTKKQELFVSEYLKCFNATKAGKAAGYKGTSARQHGSKLLTNPDIASRVQERLREAAMEADEVLYHLAEIARGDMNDLVDESGKPDMKVARENGKTRLIKKIRTVNNVTEGSSYKETEIEGQDRLKALELLGKHHKLFTEKQEITGEDGKPIPVLITGMDMDEL
jgi:phage terminase small subunit